MGKEQPIAMEILSELKRSSARKDTIIVVLIIALIVSNLSWLIYESQWEDVTETEQVIENITDTDNTNFSQQIN